MVYGVMISSQRKKHKLSQKELGDALGIGVSSVSMWESEKREPSLDNLKSMAELFGVSVDYILCGTSEELKLTKEQTEFLDLLSQLTENQKYEVRGFIKGITLYDGGAK